MRRSVVGGMRRPLGEADEFLGRPTEQKMNDYQRPYAFSFSYIVRLMVHVS